LFAARPTLLATSAVGQEGRQIVIPDCQFAGGFFAKDGKNLITISTDRGEMLGTVIRCIDWRRGEVAALDQ
jgi:hypothetical protein